MKFNVQLDARAGVIIAARLLKNSLTVNTFL